MGKKVISTSNLHFRWWRTMTLLEGMGGYCGWGGRATVRSEMMTQMSMLCICIDVARQLRQRQRRCKATKGPLNICISADNDVGKGDATLYLSWRQCRCQTILSLFCICVGADAVVERHRHRCKASASASSPYLSSSFSLIIHNSHLRPSGGGARCFIS